MRIIATLGWEIPESMRRHCRYNVFHELFWDFMHITFPVFWEGKVLQIDGFRYPVWLACRFFLPCFSSASSKHFDDRSDVVSCAGLGKNTQLP